MMPSALACIALQHKIPKYEVLEFQPTENIQIVCDIYFRSILLENSGMVVPQHSHGHDHATYVASGSVRAWVDGKFKKDYKAGDAIEIKALQEHIFMSLEPNTRLTCVHDLKSAALIEEQ